MPSAIMMRIAAVMPNLYILDALERMRLVKNSMEIFVIVQDVANRIARAKLSLRDIALSSGGTSQI